MASATCVRRCVRVSARMSSLPLWPPRAAGLAACSQPWLPGILLDCRALAISRRRRSRRWKPARCGRGTGYNAVSQRRPFMPPLVISPLVRLALGAVGTGVVLRWVVKEVRRINAELDRVKEGNDPAVRRTFPTLRRDPHTGDWRVM